MSKPTPTVADHDRPVPQLGMADKARTAGVVLVAVYLFFTVGWMAMAPDDPRGAVSTMTHSGAAAMVIELLVLAVVIAAITTAVCSSRLPDVGALTVALGIAVANLRGQTSTYLLMYLTGGDSARRASVALRLALEGFLWFGIILAALVASGLVLVWLAPPTRHAASGATRFANMAIHELPGADGLIGGHRLAPAYHWRHGLTHSAVCLAIAMLAIRVLATGAPTRSVQHGQVYFAVGVAFYLGTMGAARLFPVRTCWWSCLAVPLACFLGFAWSWITDNGGGAHGLLANVPPSSFFRPLPVTYVSVGTVAAIVSFWNNADRPSRRHPVTKEGRRGVAKIRRRR